MEALKKQNEDLNTRLTIAEGRNNRRDREREERCERDKHAQIRKGKRHVDPINKLRKAQFKVPKKKGLTVNTLLNNCSPKRLIRKDLAMLRKTT